MTTITRQEFYELLSGMDAGTPVGIVTLTEPRMRKTGNPYVGNCQRLAKRNGFIGCEYESCANNAMERAGLPRDFVAGPLPWGERDGRYFIQHKGNKYLRFYPVPGTTQDRWQTMDGTEIDKTDIEEFLYSSKDNPVPWRTVRLDHLMSCNVAGEQYTLTD